MSKVNKAYIQDRIDEIQDMIQWQIAEDIFIARYEMEQDIEDLKEMLKTAKD